MVLKLRGLNMTLSESYSERIFQVQDFVEKALSEFEEVLAERERQHQEILRQEMEQRMKLAEEERKRKQAEEDAKQAAEEAQKKIDEEVMAKALELVQEQPHRFRLVRVLVTIHVRIDFYPHLALPRRSCRPVRVLQ
jgi:restriction endonuclease Mrr